MLNKTLLLFALLYLFPIQIFAKINSYTLIFSPYFSRKEVRPITEVNKENDIPWTNGLCIKLQAKDYINETSRFLYSIGYNSGTLSSSDTYNNSPIAFTQSVYSFEWNANYSYDIFLSHKLILNPEIGISAQLPIMAETSSSNSNQYIINFKTIAPPVLGITMNVWFKPHHSSISDLGIGICGNMPVIRSSIGETKSQETHAINPIKIGMGYLGLAICYTYHKNRK